jgi:hypothetical protein
LGRQLHRQIFMKSKKFQNSKKFLGKIFLDIKAIDDLNVKISKISKIKITLLNSQKKLVKGHVEDFTYIFSN